MYLHIGGDAIIEKTGVIGIFDLDNASKSHITRRFLANAERGGKIRSVTDELPKSFILCDGGIYLSQLSSAALIGRIKN